MGQKRRKDRQPSEKKVRVPFRRNRSKPPRTRDWTRRAREAGAEMSDVEAAKSETIVSKGDRSRHRTITVRDAEGAGAAGLRRGIVMALRGLYADVHDGERLYLCTVRRVLRTRLIKERHPVTVGDRVLISVAEGGSESPPTGVVEDVAPRRGQLQRLAGRRVQTIAANVDQALIVTSAAEPYPKPHLVDRYTVAAQYGGIEPVVCLNKIDLDPERTVPPLLDRYRLAGIRTLAVSARTGEGIDELRFALKDKSTAVTGQSGVGKSSLLNAIQPALDLPTAEVSADTQKGKHTTTTAELIRLDMGGYVVDTPGVRAFDVTIVPRNELERCFVEFVDEVANCKFPNCTHIHEGGCAVKDAVSNGRIHPDRYESYVRLFEEASHPSA